MFRVPDLRKILYTQY